MQDCDVPLLRNKPREGHLAFKMFGEKNLINSTWVPLRSLALFPHSRLSHFALGHVVSDAKFCYINTVTMILCPGLPSEEEM